MVSSVCVLFMMADTPPASSTTIAGPIMSEAPAAISWTVSFSPMRATMPTSTEARMNSIASCGNHQFSSNQKGCAPWPPRGWRSSRPARRAPPSTLDQGMTEKIIRPKATAVMTSTAFCVPLSASAWRRRRLAARRLVPSPKPTSELDGSRRTRAA